MPEPRPHEVAETIARAIEPNKTVAPYGQVRTRLQAMHRAAQIARQLFPAPTERTRPEARREGMTFSLQHAGHPYTVTVGTGADGRPLEIFVEYGKDGMTDLGLTARDAGIIISHALQFGATLESLAAAVSRDEAADRFGNPIEPATFGPAVGQAQSLIGAVLDATLAELGQG